MQQQGSFMPTILPLNPSNQLNPNQNGMGLSSNPDLDSKMLQQYKDKMTVMSQLCQEAGGYFTKIKNSLTLPLILISAILMVLNSFSANQEDKNVINVIMYINISLNFINFIIVTYQSKFKIAEKAQTFRNTRDDFIRLLHSVDTAKNGGTLNNQYLCNLIDKYDTLMSNCPSFPGHIKSKISNQYKDTIQPDNMPIVLTATLVQ